MFTHEGYSHKDLIRTLGKNDAEWFINGCPIPLRGGHDLWNKKTDIYDKIEKAQLSKKEVTSFKAPRIYICSDDLGTQGLLNHADGKMYDSKSAYYRAIKDKGLVIDERPIAEPSKPKTQDINWEQAVSETIKQTQGV